MHALFRLTVRPDEEHWRAALYHSISNATQGSACQTRAGMRRHHDQVHALLFDKVQE
jgi:hypothetical protein